MGLGRGKLIILFKLQNLNGLTSLQFIWFRDVKIRWLRKRDMKFTGMKQNNYERSPLLVICSMPTSNKNGLKGAHHSIAYLIHKIQHFVILSTTVMNVIKGLQIEFLHKGMKILLVRQVNARVRTKEIVDYVWSIVPLTSTPCLETPFSTMLHKKKQDWSFVESSAYRYVKSYIKWQVQLYFLTVSQKCIKN